MTEPDLPFAAKGYVQVAVSRRFGEAAPMVPGYFFNPAEGTAVEVARDLDPGRE